VVRVLEAAQRSLYHGGLPEALCWDEEEIWNGRRLGQDAGAPSARTPVESLPGE
jgi:hypothetical protein